MTDAPVIETERLILRQHRQGDFEPYAAFYAHPTAPRYIGGPRSRADAWRALGWTTAISLVDPENTSSIRLAERLGAVFEDRQDPGFGMMNIYRHPDPDVVLQ